MKDSLGIKKLFEAIGTPSDLDVKDKLVVQGVFLETSVAIDPPCSILQLAFQYNLVDTVALLLAYGADVTKICGRSLDNNVVWDFGLVQALQDNNEAMFKIFLEHSANANIDRQFPFALNQTLLHMATATENDYFFNLLLAKGANPNVYDVREGTPLHYAALQGHVVRVRKLLALGVDVNTRNPITPLWVASFNNKIEAEAELLKQGGLLFVGPGLDLETQKRFLAVLTRHPDIDCSRLQGFILRLLMNRYMDPNLVDDDAPIEPNENLDDLTDPNPTKEIYLQLMAYLLEHGPTVIIPENRVNHPLDQSTDDDSEVLDNFIDQTIHFHPHILKLLLNQKNFDVNASISSINFYPLLHEAVINGAKKSVELFLARKDLRINQVDYQKNTALIYAVAGSSYEVVKALLKIEGIATNTWHKISKKLSRDFGNETLLTVHGEKKIEIQGTPLHLAALCRPSLVMPLLKAGAHLEVKTDCNLTPFQIVGGILNGSIYHHGNFIIEGDGSSICFMQVQEGMIQNPSSNFYQAYLDAYCELLKSGAGIYADMTSLPLGLDTTNLVVIGLKYNGVTVSRETKGFEKAITSSRELIAAMQSGVEINRESMARLCDRQQDYSNDSDISHSLHEIKLILRRCEPETTLQQTCLNRINFSFNPKFFALRSYITNFQLYLMPQLPSPETTRLSNIITPFGLFQYNSLLNHYKCQLTCDELKNLGLQDLLQTAGQITGKKSIAQDLQPEQIVKLNELLIQKESRLFPKDCKIDEELFSKILALS